MSDFNYQEYLRNNPLLKEEVKDQLITESQEIEEVELPATTVNKTNAEVTNIKTMAQAMLDYFDQIKEKEAVDFEANANMKVALDRLKKLAKTEEEEIDEVRPGYGVGDFGDPMENDLIKAVMFLSKQAKKAGKKVADFVKDIEVGSMQQAMATEEVTEETTSKMKVSELKAKIKEDILSVLSEAEEEVDVDVDVEDKVEVEAGADDIEIERPGVKTTVDVGLSPEEEVVQDSLKAAMDAANELGNQKLADQIGNTITFFTREFVVGQNTD